MVESPALAKAEKQATAHLPISGTSQIRTVIRSPVWAVSGDLLLVAIVTVDRPSDKDDLRTPLGTRNFNPSRHCAGYFPVE
jgi:hypothetical protein